MVIEILLLELLLLLMFSRDVQGEYWKTIDTFKKGIERHLLFEIL